MAQEPMQIKRYPNRRFYARDSSRYVSLVEIEELVRQGRNVQIRDSQTGEDITRAVLTQIIVERHPEKMNLFPPDMLHAILRANDLMSEFLRGYFRDALTYLDYLQTHGTPSNLARPMHWMQAWLEGLGVAPRSPANETPSSAPVSDASRATPDPHDLHERILQLENRIRQLESEGKSGG